VTREDGLFFSSRFTVYGSRLLVFVLVVGVLVVFIDIFFGDVELDGVESDDLQLGCALVTGDRVALVGVEVNVDFGFAVRTRSYRHFSFLQVSSRREARPTLIGRVPHARSTESPPTI
jgi:hypothetical protein